MIAICPKDLSYRYVIEINTRKLTLIGAGLMTPKLRKTQQTTSEILEV